MEDKTILSLALEGVLFLLPLLVVWLMAVVDR